MERFTPSEGATAGLRLNHSFEDRAPVYLDILSFKKIL